MIIVLISFNHIRDNDPKTIALLSSRLHVISGFGNPLPVHFNLTFSFSLTTIVCCKPSI